MLSKPIAKVVLIILFVGLIATPLVLKRLSAQRQQRLSTSDAQSAISRYGVHFDEVARERGINFIHQAPTLDHKLDHIMPQVASMGAAVSIVDFDRDGYA